jgi:hypothetical protein
MSLAHKAALAAGREDGRAVKAYLEALALTTPKRRGRRRGKQEIERRLVGLEKELDSASALMRLHLVQERRDLKRELEEFQRSEVDLKPLRKRFLAVAKRYSERKGISYDAWREVGVDAQTLKEAGISR